MNHELAKELKDAGFPQQDRLYYFTDEMSEDSDPMYYVGIETPSDEDIAAPTLEELIEACGDDFLGLYKQKNEFWARSIRSQSVSERVYLSATPEEAVAKLWLAINKK